MTKRDGDGMKYGPLQAVDSAERVGVCGRATD